MRYWAIENWVRPAANHASIALAVSSGVQSDAARPEAEPVGLCLALGHVKLKQVWFSLSATVRQRPSTFHLYRSVLPGRSPFFFSPYLYVYVWSIDILLYLSFPES